MCLYLILYFNVLHLLLFLYSKLYYESIFLQILATIRLYTIFTSCTPSYITSQFSFKYLYEKLHFLEPKRPENWRKTAEGFLPIGRSLDIAAGRRAGCRWLADLSLSLSRPSSARQLAGHEEKGEDEERNGRGKGPTDLRPSLVASVSGA